MVMLFACRTAGGVVVNGEGIQGLTAAFLQAGARSVVATSWRVGGQARAAVSCSLSSRPPRRDDVVQRRVRRRSRKAELLGSSPSVTSRTHQRYTESARTRSDSLTVIVVSAVVSENTTDPS